jgi:hypothetical protein
MKKARDSGITSFSSCSSSSLNNLVLSYTSMDCLTLWEGIFLNDRYLTDEERRCEPLRFIKSKYINPIKKGLLSKACFIPNTNLIAIGSSFINTSLYNPYEFSCSDFDDKGISNKCGIDSDICSLRFYEFENSSNNMVIDNKSKMKNMNLDNGVYAINPFTHSESPHLILSSLDVVYIYDIRSEKFEWKSLSLPDDPTTKKLLESKKRVFPMEVYDVDANVLELLLSNNNLIGYDTRSTSCVLVNNVDSWFENKKKKISIISVAYSKSRLVLSVVDNNNSKNYGLFVCDNNNNSINKIEIPQEYSNSPIVSMHFSQDNNNNDVLLCGDKKGNAIFIKKTK